MPVPVVGSSQDLIITAAVEAVLRELRHVDPAEVRIAAMLCREEMQRAPRLTEFIGCVRGKLAAMPSRVRS